MANYINTKTLEYPLSENLIRNRYPTVSFPVPFVPSSDYAIVFDTPKPEHNPVISYAVETAPTSLMNGAYRQSWEIVSRFKEYTDADGIVHSVAEQEAIAIAAHQRIESEQFQKFIVTETQKKLDAFAATRGYDDVNSTAKYKDISDEDIQMLPEDEQPLVTKFRAECRYLSISVARTWAKLYLILAEVQAGTRVKPESFADVEAELPELSWPI